VPFVLVVFRNTHRMEPAMQFFTLIPYTILSIRFLLLICRIPDRPLDWLLS
jgi:hypothetical protein